MEETRWTGKGDDSKASNEYNWDNGIPGTYVKAIFGKDIVDRTEVIWDIMGGCIDVDIQCDPEFLIVYISSDCMVGGTPWAPETIIKHFESFQEDIPLDQLDMPPPGYSMFRAAYVSTQTGDWDNVATWGGGGFPGVGDTATISNTHVVSVKGAEHCSTCTINIGGTLRFDGQTDSVNATLTVSGSIVNGGTVDSTGTGSSGMAGMSGGGAFTGNEPSWGSGFWLIGGIDMQIDITTGGGGCTWGANQSTLDALTLSSGDTWYDNSDFYISDDFTIENGFTATFVDTLVQTTGTLTISDNRATKTPFKYWNIGSFGAGTITLGTDIQVIQLDVYETFDMNDQDITLMDTASLNNKGIWIDSGGTWTKGTGTLTVIQANGSYIKIEDSNATNNDLGDVSVTTGTLRLDSAKVSDLELANGTTLNLASDNEDLQISGDVDLISASTWTHGTGTITFDGTTTYTDNNGTAQDIGNTSITGDLTLASHIHFGTMDISGSFNAASYSILCDGTSWDCSGTFVYGTSEVSYSATCTVTGMTGATNQFYDVEIDLGADVTTDSAVRVIGSKTVTGTDNISGTSSDFTYINNDLSITGTLNSKGFNQGVIIYTGSRVPSVKSPYVNIIQQGGS